MANFWQKLNYLVPEPQCRTKNNQIIEWTDSRVQPTDAEINVITDGQVEDSELDKEANGALENEKVKRLLFEINFEQENRMRVLESRPTITKAQYKTATVTLYKTL